MIEPLGRIRGKLGSEKIAYVPGLIVEDSADFIDLDGDDDE